MIDTSFDPLNEALIKDNIALDRTIKSDIVLSKAETSYPVFLTIQPKYCAMFGCGCFLKISQISTSPEMFSLSPQDFEIPS
jgi:hypothetical protein